MFLTYATHEDALEALDNFRALNSSNNNLRFLAQLWHERHDVLPVSPPRPTLTVHLGFHGTIDDVHRLFQDWPQGTKPMNVRLGKCHLRRTA